MAGPNVRTCLLSVDRVSDSPLLDEDLESREAEWEVVENRIKEKKEQRAQEWVDERPKAKATPITSASGIAISNLVRFVLTTKYDAEVRQSQEHGG